MGVVFLSTSRRLFLCLELMRDLLWVVRPLLKHTCSNHYFRHTGTDMIFVLQGPTTLSAFKEQAPTSIKVISFLEVALAQLRQVT